jgi:short-subunit dehydrogenase
MVYWHSKRAVITGGSAGLGRELARVLVERGARVAIVARRAEPLETTAAELRGLGGQVLTVAADVTNSRDVDQLATTIQSAWGGLDLLCNCAGRSMRGTVLGTSVEDFRALWEVNFLSALQCSQTFARTLTENHGHIVLVGSLASKTAAGYLGAYPASKFPLAALAQQLRVERREGGPHVLLVCPGPIARGADDSEHAAARYAEQFVELPAAAQKPGGGAKVRAIDPRRLSEQILDACQQRRAELVVPVSARLLFAISQLSPSVGDWLLRRMTSG